MNTIISVHHKHWVIITNTWVRFKCGQFLGSQTPGWSVLSTKQQQQNEEGAGELWAAALCPRWNGNIHGLWIWDLLLGGGRWTPSQLGILARGHLERPPWLWKSALCLKPALNKRWVVSVSISWYVVSFRFNLFA